MRSDDAYVEDIRLATVRIAQYIEGMSRTEFVVDEKTRAAVEREMTIIGEASGKVSAAFKSEHANFPWQQLVRLRNFYVHAYERLSPTEVWGTAFKLAPRVGRLVAALTDEDTTE